MIVEESDLAKYLEIYDISDADLCDASFGFPQYMHEDGNDHQSLKYLRVASARQSILRRLLLCALLAIPADMTSANLPRWEQVTGRMLTIAEACGSASNRLTEAQLIEEGAAISHSHTNL